jgi:urease accessory protein
MRTLFPALDVVFIESGEDNLAATFSQSSRASPSTSSTCPRATRSRARGARASPAPTDLAPLVGADLCVMERDARRMRAERPFVFTNVRAGTGVQEVVDLITLMGGLAAPAA